ncbi:MAG: hypothetical protein ABIO65_09155 [Nitrospiria bacterium]
MKTKNDSKTVLFLTLNPPKASTQQRVLARYVAERVKRIPGLGWARKVVGAFFTGRDFIVVAVKNPQ